MLLIFFIVCMIYFILYSSFGEERPKNVDVVIEQEPEPFEYKIDYDDKNKYLTLSGKGSWSFDLEDNYIYDKDYKFIVEKDECFGKPNGTKIRASGKKLYEYLQENDLKILDNKIDEKNYFISNKLNFYLDCADNKIRDIYTCPPGKIFHDGECQPVNVCTGQKDGKIFPVLNDRHYYQICENEKPIRKRCKPDTFFMVDSCRSEKQLNDFCKNNNVLNSVFPINNKKFIRCINDEPMVEYCPQNMIILPSWDKCYPDNCLQYPDGYKKPMSNVTFNLFTYSPGYFVCQDNKISKSIYCQNQWDYYKKTANLPSQLPMVFDSEAKKCVIPSFCENVKGIDDNVVVPVHEFTKHVKNWKYSHLFDSVVGFRCEQKLSRFTLDPGKQIKDFRIISACDENNLIPIGNEINSFYDCRERKIIHCQPNEIFHVEKGCIKSIHHAHNFKNMSMFRLGNLSKYNNWLIPWEPDKNIKKKKSCQDTKLKYLENYDVCVHPDCEKYPFLKQFKSIDILIPDRDKYAACVYNDTQNTILKKSYWYEDGRILKYWFQRLIPKELIAEKDECVPGQKVQSGNFLIDSTIYATCDNNQPFVFCPSSSTKGIKRLTNNNLFACVPNNEVYEAIIPANTKVKFYTQEISYILPNVGASYSINEEQPKIFSDKIIPIYLKQHPFTFESSEDSKIFYRNLVNYPINVYIKNRELKEIKKSTNWAYWLKKDKFSPRPVKIADHNIEEEVF